MSEAYFNLKLKLEDLGYNNTLPVDAVPLVECMLADLLQTTRSLQHYMTLAKDALKQRDSLLLEAEPYRCENAKLIQENNQLHRETIELQEEIDRITKENKRKFKILTEELTKKDIIISRLQLEVRDLSLRGLCADTQSSRNKSRRKDAGDNVLPRPCSCHERGHIEKEDSDLSKTVQSLENKIDAYCDEISLLKKQLENRVKEIVRLNMLLEGGRPLTAITRDFCKNDLDHKVQELTKQLQDVETSNDFLKSELGNGLEKQHEAMLRALNLAEKNKKLQNELQKVDELALKVEEDCNKRLSTMMNEVNFLQTKIDTLTIKNTELEKLLSNRNDTVLTQKLQDQLDMAVRETSHLTEEIKKLTETNQKLQDTVNTLSEKNEKLRTSFGESGEQSISAKKQYGFTKEELQQLFEKERKKYEKHLAEVQGKLEETFGIFNKHLNRCKQTNIGSNNSKPVDVAYLKDLHKKLCESEQKLLMQKKENDELKIKISHLESNCHGSYTDIIKQLNAENSELSQENIRLSQQLSQHKIVSANCDKVSSKNEIQKLKREIERLTNEIQILNKDKQEYNLRCKEAVDLTDKLRRDLACKQRDIEKLQEENSSYKMSSRNGKASVDHLRDECNFLREQLKRMQTDIIKEKTLANQIKNLQQESERSSSEMHNELLTTQKKLSMNNDTIQSLEKKCKELQLEILTLTNDKSNLIDTIKKMDQEQSTLIIEFDHKTEEVCTLEQKLKSKTYDVHRLENELSELQRKLNFNKVTEHKLEDSETQTAFLNGEVLRLTQKLEAAIMENKHLQNSLADVNGTLKVMRIEYDKSKKEAEGLRQQLQHYVDEIRRIEELLSHKEAERSDMLEQFASLSVEANILENTNHSLESESASKSALLQSYVSKIESLEARLVDKDNIIESQSTRIATMTCKITSLEKEIKLINEEKAILEQNVQYLKQMCNSLNTDNVCIAAGMGDSETEIKLYENKIKNLMKAKAKLTTDNEELQEKMQTLEKLLSNTRKEIVDLKLALQDATAETKSLQEQLQHQLNIREDSEFHKTSLMREDLSLPVRIEESVHEMSHEEDEYGSHYLDVHKRYCSKYTTGHSSTL